MSDYTFYQLDEKLSEKFHIPDLPIPIRTENIKSIFGKGDVNIAHLIDDCGEFIAEHSEYKKTYKPILISLAHKMGLALGMKGKHEEAALLFKKGLEYDPHNIALMSARAHALVMLEQDDEAYKTYKEIVDDPDVQVNPLLWILAARSAVKVEKFTKAYAILDDCSKFVKKSEKGFWNFYNDVAKQAEVKRLQNVEPVVVREVVMETPPPKTVQKKFCGKCGKPLKPGAKFCGGCGNKL